MYTHKSRTKTIIHDAPTWLSLRKLAIPKTSMGWDVVNIVAIATVLYKVFLCVEREREGESECLVIMGF